MYVKSVLLLTAFVASAVAGPLSSRGSCARHCTESTKLKYEVGKTYKYDYASDTTTTMSGTIDEESRLHIKASVHFTVHSKCDLSMQLEDITLEESDPKYSSSRQQSKNSGKFSQDLQKYSLRFSFQDGKIDDICPSPLEPSWVLNLKRGILSTFQNNMQRLDQRETVQQVDVAGKCEVQYEPLGSSWGTVSIRATKDLVTCTHRQSASTALQSTTYNHQSNIKSLPLISGTQKCEQSFSYQRIQKVECEEKLVFRPFANKESGAVTKATQTLTYNSEKRSTFAGDDYEAIRSTLIFNHDLEGTTEERKFHEAEESLREICANSVDDIRKEVPHLFTQYVYRLRKLSHADLRAMYSRTTSICKFNRKAKKYFTDALPILGTEQAIRMMIEMVTEKKVSDSEADYWFTSFAFMPKVDLKMFRHVIAALDNPRKQAVLGISSMVQTYCLTDSTCENKPEIRRIITKLVGMLNGNCQAANEAESEKILLVLKGIGNAGHSRDAQAALSSCARNTRTSIEIRIAAIEAFRRQSCTVSRQSLLRLFRDLQEDTEVRIAAYLAVMRCPTPSIIQSVKQLLEAEEVNQVGSFVWTHLTSMQETTDPCKHDIKELLRNVFLAKKFDTDVRKFSRAYEGSVFSEKLNTGAHIDSNVIFTPQSYLPRSAMFNLTMDLFGHSINMFEVGGRVEGFEHLVESFFGPNGYFPEKNVQKFLRSSRTKRSVYDNKIEEFKRLFQARGINHDVPKGSMYFKMFGNELMYGGFNGLDSLMNYAETKINWLEILRDLAQNKDVEYTKSMMFMDASYTIPTSTGLPLSLTVNGTSTMNLKIGGKLDVRNLLKKEIDIDGHIKPSGAVEISAVMSVDAFYARTGLKMVATMHSSTFIDGKIKMNNGKILTTQINVPHDKVEIFDVQTNIFLIHQDVERPQAGVEEERTDMQGCTGSIISTVTGMKLCSILQFPNASMKYDSPYFPMTGPTRFSVYLEKTDLKMKSYKFDATLENTDKKKAVLLSFDTPGSEVDREMTVELALDKDQKTMALRLRTPLKKVGVSGKFTDSEAQKKMEFTVTVDDLEKLALLAQLDIQKISDSTRYTPLVEIRTPGMKKISLKGYTLIQPNKRYISAVTIENLTQRLIELKVDVSKQGEDRYNIESKLNSYVLSTKIRGNVHMRQRVTTTNMNIDYSILESKKEQLKIGTKFQDMSASTLLKFKVGINVDSSAAPDYNTQLNWETQIADGHLENTLKLSQGIKGKNKIDITIQEIVSYNFLPGKNSIYTNFKIKIPVKKINYVWYFKHQNTATYVKTRAFVQYASRQRVDLQFLGLSVDKKVSAQVKFNYPGREMLLQSTMEETAQKKYEGSLLVQWARGKKVTAVATLTDKSSTNEIYHDINVEVNTPEKKIQYIGEAKSNEAIHMLKNKLTVGNDLYTANAEYLRAQRKFSAAVYITGKTYTVVTALTEASTSVAALFDMKLDNYRHVKSSASYSWLTKRVGKFVVYWDADKDQSRRVEINASHEKSTDEVVVSVYYPVRTLSATLKPQYQDGSGYINAKVEADFSWESAKKVSMEFNIRSSKNLEQVTTTFRGRSPFQGYRELFFRHTHQKNNKVIVIKTSATLERRNFVNLDFNGMFQNDRSTRLTGDLKLTSSMEDYKSFGLEFEHTSSETQFRNNASLSWGEYDAVRFSLNGVDSSDYYNTNMQGEFYFSSPFESYRELSGNVFHKFSGNQITSTGNFKWSSDKEITINFGGSQMLSRGNNICKSTLRITTPYRDYYSIQSTVTYQNDGQKIKTDADLQWPQNKFTAGWDASRVNSRNKKKTDVSMYLTTPYSGYEDMSVSTSYEADDYTFDGSINLVLDQATKYKIESQGKYNAIDHFEIEGKINTPISTYERMSYKLTHRVRNNELKSYAEASVNDQKSSLDLKVKYVNIWKTDLDWSVVLTTPMESYSKIVVSGKHQYQRGSATNNIKYQNGWRKVVLDHTLRYTDMMSYRNKIELTHPYRKYPQLTLENTQTLQKSFLSHKTTLNADDSKYWKFTTEVKVQEGKMEGLVDVEDHDGKIFLFDATHAFSDNSYNPSLHLTWRRDISNAVDNFFLSGSWNIYQTMKRSGQLRLTSSLKGYESLSLKGDYDFEYHTKSARISFTTPASNVISLSGKVDTYKKSAIITFVSPFENYEELILAGSYIYGDNMKGDVSFQWAPTKKIELSGAVISKEQEAAATVTFSSPFESYEKLIFATNYDVSREVKTAQTSFQYGPNKKITVNQQIKITSDSGNAKITFTSPFEKYSFVSAETNYDASGDRKTAKLSLEWPSYNKFSVDGEMNFGEKVQYAVVTINTPVEDMKSLVLSAKLDSSREVMTGSLKSTWNSYNTMELSGNFQKNSGRLIKGSLKFSSPFEKFRDLRFDVNMEKYAQVYKGSSSFSWDAANRMFVDVEARTNPYILTIKADSPFDPIKNVLFDAKFVNDDKLRDLEFTTNVEWKNVNKISVNIKKEVTSNNELRSSLLITTPFEKFAKLSLRSSFMIHNNVIAAGFSAETPFESLRSLEISSTFKNEQSNKINYAFKVDTDVTIMQVTMSYKLDGERTETKMYFNAPYLYKKPITGDFLRFENQHSININNGYNTYTLKYTIKDKPEDKWLSAELMIPTLDYKYRVLKLDTSFKHLQDSMDATFQVQNVEDTHKATFSLNNGYKSMNAEMELETPALASNKMTLVGNVQYGDVKKISINLNSRYSLSGEIETLKKEEFSGYMTFDSPSDFFGRAKVTADYKNVEMKNIEGSLKVETPFEKFRAASINGKYKQNSRSTEAKISLEIPVPEYERLSAEMKVKHNGQWTEVQPSVTLAWPRSQFTLSTEYVDTDDRRTMKVGISKNRQKLSEVTVQVEKKNHAILLILKKLSEARRMEQYSAQLSYRVENGHHFLDGSLSLPDNERATLNSQFFYYNWNNFDGRVSATSSFTGYEALSTSVSRRVSRRNTVAQFTSSWSRRKMVKVSFVTNEENGGQNGKFEVVTPWSIVQEISTTYDYSVKNSKQNFNFEINYLRNMFLQITTSCEERRYESTRTMSVEIPKIGLKGSSMYKTGPKPEFTFRVEIPSRVVFFRTVYAPTAIGFKHSAEFAWDQRTARQASYEVNYADRSVRDTVGGELVIRVIHPIRAVEVKFVHQLTSRDATFTTKFMWDPLRDNRKQITVILEGHDTSVYGKQSYNGIITLKTPRLYNDVKLSGSVDFSDRHREMFKTNVKLDYTGDRRKALEYEMKLIDETRRRNREGISYTFTSRLIHPASVTYVNIFSTITLNDQTNKLDARFNYVDKFSERKTYMLRTILNKKKLTMQMALPKKSYNLVGKLESHSAELAIHEDGKQTLLAQCSFQDDEDIIAQADVLYIPTNDGLKFRAFSGRSVSIELNHKNSGHDISDFLFTLGLSTPRILSSRIIWRTTVLSELEEKIKSCGYNMIEMLKTKAQEMIDHAETEVENKIANIRRVNAAEMKPLFDDWTALKASFYQDYLVLSQQAKTMYRNNEFYVKNIDSAMKSASKYIGMKIQLVKQSVTKYWGCFKSSVSEVASIVYINLEQGSYAIKQTIIEMYYDAVNSINDLRSAIAEKYRQLYFEAYYYVRQGLKYTREYFINMGECIAEKIRYVVRNYLPFVETIGEYYEDFCDYLVTLKNRFYNSKYYLLAYKYYVPVYQFLSEVYEMELVEIASHRYEEIWNKMADKYTTAKDSFNGYYEAVLKHPHIAMANELANHGYQKIAWAYRFWGIDESLNHMYENWFNIIATAGTEIAHDATAKYTAFLKDSKFVFEPFMGRIEVDIRLPSDRQNLKHLLEIDSAPEYQYIMAMKEKYLPENRLTLWDHWNIYKPHSDMTNWIPPFKTQAMLAGKQHFVTFDKLFYNFAGECSYVLAQDLLDGNFSVIANYQRKYNNVEKKSIVVQVDDKSIEITPTFKVMVDDSNIELPYQFGKTVITRFDDTITVSNENGVTVKCNFYRDVCTVDMSGWYFAKTGGLFGVYDNEPQMDMMKPNGKTTKSLTEFTSSWAANRGICKPDDYAQRASSNDYEVERICASVFESEDSLLRPCFKVVDTEKFMQMCLIDVQNRNRETSEDEAVCTSAYAYKQMCLTKEVETQMPNSCGRCKKPDNTFMDQGDTLTITGDNKPSATDIVFIVEEKACNKDKFDNFIEIAEGIERSLKETGIRRATYSVVAYGGDGIHDLPHIHYAESKESGTYRTVAAAFRSLVTGNGNTDVYEAIRFATNLRFTPGSAKTFILVKCSTCENKDTKNEYGDILRMLIDQEISLHVLTDNNFKLRSRSRKANGIFGLDKYEAYTAKDVRDKVLVGDKDLRAQIYDVKDFCVPLALETNGTFFNARKLLDNRRSVKKNFIHVFSRRLVKSNVASDCQLCTCHGNDDTSGKIQCYTCISPFDVGLFIPNLPEFTLWQEKSYVRSYRPKTRSSRRKKKKTN